MNGNVIVEPKDIWQYFQEHKAELHNSYHLVAESHDDGVEIYLTEENGTPFFVTEVFGKVEGEADSISEQNTIVNYRALLDIYLGEEYERDPEDEVFSGEDIDRLNEIDDALDDFLCAMMECPVEQAQLSDDERFEIIGMVAEYLETECSIPVRVPTAVEDGDTGKVSVVQYPYEP